MLREPIAHPGAVLWLLAASWAWACSDTAVLTPLRPASGPEATPGLAPEMPAFSLPKIPLAHEPTFSVEGVRNWYLVGDDLTPGQDALEISIRGPAGEHAIELWVDREYRGRVQGAEPVRFAKLPLDSLAPGEHELLLAADGQEEAFAQFFFYRSHPLYVLFTAEWDEADFSDHALALEEVLLLHHPALKVSRFVGAPLFVGGNVSAERVSTLIRWLQRRKDSGQDEFGLYLRPCCQLVQAARISCRTTPSLLSDKPDPTGCSVPVWSYTEDEVAAILGRLGLFFEEHGLGHPDSFRAADWTAGLSTLRALARQGYQVDSSAVNGKRLGGWNPGAVSQELNKLQSQWASIHDSSQPYYPSAAGIASANGPVLPILEVPDQATLVDNLSLEDLLAVLQQNWSGGALTEPRTFVVGMRTSTLDHPLLDRLDPLLTQLDHALYADDAGPVVPATLRELCRVFHQPPPPLPERVRGIR